MNVSQRGFVIGDLHLGAGAGDPLEDFFDDDALARFSERIASPETTLFLNGDVIDFAQIPPFDVPRPAHLLWDEATSVRKLETALAAHPDAFAGLRSFVDAGARLHVLAGNHDLDLAWPRVQQRLRAALGEPPAEQFTVTVGATCFAGVHIEHGYQFSAENCPRDPERFVHEWPEGGTRYLERVWGTDFMLQFYNQIEREHPFADHIKPTISVVWHGIRNGWIGGRELVRVLLFLKRRGVPWKGILDAVLDDPGPADPAVVVGSFTEPEWRRAIADRARADHAFVVELRTALGELDDHERSVVLTPEPVQLADPRLTGPGEDPPTTLGLFRDGRERRAARDRLSRDGVTAVVFGHTHGIVSGDLDGCLFNPGSWLPCLDLEAPAVRERIDRDGLTLDALKDRTLYAVDRRAVRIDERPGERTRVGLVAHDDP